MKTCLRALIILAVVIVAGGLLFNKSVEVTAEHTFNYPQTTVFNQINNLKNWANWSVWQQKDENIRILYGEVFEGEGAIYEWGSERKSIGEGSLTITKSIPSTTIEYHTDFGGKGSGVAEVNITETDEKSTNVLWTFHSETEGLLGGWVALLMKPMVKKSFVKSLQNLENYLKDNYVPEPEMVSEPDSLFVEQ